MDEELRSLEHAAQLDPSAEGQLLNALVRSGQLKPDLLHAAALLYYRGARDALGWPAEAPTDDTLASPDGVRHAFRTGYHGGHSLCGAPVTSAAKTRALVTCPRCRLEWQPATKRYAQPIRELPEQQRIADRVATKPYARALTELPEQLLVGNRVAWLTERVTRTNAGHDEQAVADWASDFDAVAVWLVDPTPTNLKQVEAAALSEEDERLECANLALHGVRMNEGLLWDLLSRAEDLLGSASLREGLARLGAWTLGRGPDPVTQPGWHFRVEKPPT